MLIVKPDILLHYLNTCFHFVIDFWGDEIPSVYLGCANRDNVMLSFSILIMLIVLSHFIAKLISPMCTTNCGNYLQGSELVCHSSRDRSCLQEVD